jgi:anti-anti-sigma factor
MADDASTRQAEADAHPPDGKVIYLTNRRFGPPPFIVTVKHEGPRVTLGLQGELDISARPELEGSLGAILSPEGNGVPLTEVILDLQELAFIDVAGVRSICRCAELGAVHGVAFRVINASPQTVRVIRLCRRLELLEPSGAS